MRNPMELKGKMTLLCSKDGVELEIEDDLSHAVILRATISTEQFCAMLGRLACVDIDIQIGELHKVGKKMEMDKLDFEMPKEYPYHNKDAAIKLAKKLCPKGWEPDLYFNSQSSFTSKDNKVIAHTTIRRWV